MTQDEALDILKMGQNVFLTGPAGSGKTYIINKYVKYLQDNKVLVAITASTGIAATHIDGRTVHSWAGIGIKTSLDKREFDSLFYNQEIRARVSSPKVLIIDEISMLDAARFNLIDRVCKRLRNNSSPFGGIQLVLCGDFFQLPPVSKRGEPQADFAFNSAAWHEAHVAICYLEKQYRQSDIRFLDILNAIRENKTTDQTPVTLFERFQKPIDGFPKPTKLYTHNKKVDAHNSFELEKLLSPLHTYSMTFDGDPDLVNELKKSCLAPHPLNVKKGALVMFVKNNFNAGYVNGTLGTVVGFDPDDEYPIVEKRDGTKIIAGPASWVTEDNDGMVLARISQIPLRLAWAITVHKSQGMSLDCAEIDLSQAFIEGMGYVALSRVRTLSGIKLMGLNELSLKVNPIISELDENLKSMSKQVQKDLKSLGWLKKRNISKTFLQR